MKILDSQNLSGIFFQADSQILKDGDDEFDVFAFDGVSAVTVIGMIDLTVAVDNLNASRIAHRSATGKGVSHDIKMLIVLIVQFIYFYTVNKEFNFPTAAVCR